MLDTVLISLLIAMRERGIGCAQSQDREAQKKPRFSIDELEKALNDSMN